MGAKQRYIIVVLFFLSAGAQSQSELNFQFIDSVTYKYYTSGDWNSLILLGNKAIDKDIDYKYLRQRIGYAYFMLGDFVRASVNFEKALRFDSFDQFTLAYLYYTNSDLAKPETSGYYASRMNEAGKKNYLIKPSKVIESIDVELSIKFPSTTLRSNPRYLRLGLGSRPWARFGLYQSIAYFNQDITVRYPTKQIEFRNKQFEYYGIVKYSLLPHWIIKTGYHFLYSDYSSAVTYTNLGYIGLSADFNILNIKLDGTITQNSIATIMQGGIRAGMSFPGASNIRLTSGIAFLSQDNNTEIIYNERIGFRVNSNAWIEGDIEWGHMNYYNDFDALYVYNSIDHLTFRTGVTTYFLTGKRMTLWINLGIERKEYYETDLYTYNQYSFLGGIKWRL